MGTAIRKPAAAVFTTTTTIRISMTMLRNSSARGPINLTKLFTFAPISWRTFTVPPLPPQKAATKGKTRWRPKKDWNMFGIRLNYCWRLLDYSGRIIE